MRAVFFDAGGTLVHIDYPRVAQCIQQVLGREVPADGWIAAEYSGRDAVEAGMARGDLPTDMSRWTVHFRAMLCSLGLSNEEFERVAPAVMAAHKQRHLWSSVFPGTTDALASLTAAEYLVGLISNADGRVDRLMTDSGLATHLRFIVDSGAVGVEKPDPRIFEMAMERARSLDGFATLEASECYYVGDIYLIDVIGAGRAGMVPVLLDPLGYYGQRQCKTIRDVPSFSRELVSARRAA